MRRVLVPVLMTACAAAALLGVLAVAMIGWVTADAVRMPDPDPPGVDTLDRGTVERLARITLPAEATDLHTRYAEGIDYILTACFQVPRSALPAFTAGLPALTPADPPDPPDPPPGCATPEPALTGTPQHLAGPVYRTIVVSDPGDGRVTVYLTAFTT